DYFCAVWHGSAFYIF
nr:immunoglobulin light chain junction region [Macaca mulatta]